MDKAHQDYLDALDRAERNRRNAQHSTGPRTEAGLAVSKLNAVKTGLTGRTVLLRTDDVARYEQHVAHWFADRNPQSPRENLLTQSIADTEWRLERIIQIESSLYALGRVRFEADLRNEMADDVPDALIPSMLDAHTHMFYEKQFRNLGVQEARLRRQRDKDLKELKELQDERLAKTSEQNEQSRRATQSTNAGFVFANGETAASNSPEDCKNAAMTARQTRKQSRLVRKRLARRQRGTN